MTAVDTDVVIVGAGMAGLALAVALARDGLTSVIVEAGDRPEAPPESVDLDAWDHRVSALTPGTRRFLEGLGVWSRMPVNRLAPYDRMRVWDGEGTGEIHFSAAEMGIPELGHIVENRVTVAALVDAAEAARGTEVWWGEALAGVDADSGDGVQVATSGGRTLRAPLLVGADGARSGVRERLGFRTRAWPYRQHALVATLALGRPHDATCYQAFLPTGPVALLPLADPNLSSLVWSIDDPVWEGLLNGDDGDFIHALNRALAGRAPEITAVGQRAAFPLHQCHAVDYIRPGVALVADAAHSIHPLAGQGINLGLADVAALAGELVEASRGDLDWGDTRVLSRYQRRRKSDNLAMMAAMEGFRRGFGSDNPLVRVLRNAGLNWVQGALPLKRWLMAQALD